MKKRKEIEELTIADDFMFGAVMSDPKLCKPLLEYILNIKIRQIEYPELQKTIDKRYDSKSVRLDVYVEDDKNTVYNVEIQTTSKKNLPKRMRYYQGIIDLNIIDKGEDYAELKKSFVIFICTFDPFGKDRYIYTFKNRCDEERNITLDDDAIKVVVNVNGKIGDISEELKDTLNYIAGGVPKTDYVKSIDTAVDVVKKDKKWRREYMTLYMRDKEHEKFGKYTKTISLIRKKKNSYDEDALMDLYDVNETECKKIIFYIDNYPEWDDEDIANKILNDDE
ncbi:MAG: Rpn family recombination-promoting nuclease/putative transposase [Firmicutes bacterium]|nr:Rpn family recombination-promoting nuclease/putative transposase [Bacillota bacterium]